MPTDLPLAHDRSGPRGPADHDGSTVVLLHAGIADRRMWDAQWEGLSAAHDTVRLDLRGFGASTRPPTDLLDHVGDVLDCLSGLGIRRAHLVGASMGAGVAVEVALERPDLAASLVLLTPGGSLIPDWTPQLREFVTAERAALAAGDLDAATEVNLRWWLEAPGRRRDRLDPHVRARARAMQRNAFAVQDAWSDDLEEAEPDRPPTDRLAELDLPVTVVTTGLDLDAIDLAARGVLAAQPAATHVHLPDVAHLPAMEAPEQTTALIQEHLTRVG